MHHLAIFGGTFDPIHNGHLKTSLNIQAYFKFDQYFFLPCKIPVLKPPTITTEKQRIAMIELAIAHYPDFQLDLREIKRDSPSYMVDTLLSFRQDYPEASITLIIGYDSFLLLSNWYQWQKLITLANILVINRQEFLQKKIPTAIQTFLEKYQAKNKALFLSKKFGNIFLFDAGNYNISSTKIREEIKNKQELDAELPKEVLQYINTLGLYQ